jgi:hypothetical protein
MSGRKDTLRFTDLEEEHLDKMLELYNSGWTHRRIARLMGVSDYFVRTALAFRPGYKPRRQGGQQKGRKT